MKHKDWLTALVFSYDGLYLASSSYDGFVSLWAVDTEEKIDSFSRGSIARSVDLNSNGTLIAAGFYKIATVIQFPSFKRLCDYWYGDRVWSLVFSPDGELLATGTHTISVWNLLTGRTVFTASRLPSIFSLAFSPDGRYLAAGCEYNLVKIWNIITGEVVAEFHQEGWVYSVEFSPDGRYLAVGGDKGFLDVYDWQRKKLVTKTRVPNFDIGAITWNSRFLVYVDRTKLVSNFVELHHDKIIKVRQSRRGFLALGYKDGKIEIIREGKEL